MPADQPDTQLADVLTPLAMTILREGGEEAYTRLVVRGPGSAKGKQLLTGVTAAQLVSRPVADRQAADALLAGLWLWHDWLDESHQISQSIASPTGSFWHAIMHRREGDFGNSKYWYARCKTHPVMRTIAVGATPILGDPATREQGGIGDRMSFSNGFDPDDFVDWVEQVHARPGNDPGYRAAVEIQKLEWRALFTDCAFAAAGAGTILGGGIESEP
jgi:hypothetical protein